MTDTANRSVMRAFRLIDELSTNGSAGVTALAERVDLPVSTVHNYLQALQETGYVVKDGTEYRTSTRFLEVGHRERRRTTIYNAVSDELQALAEGTGEQATLIVAEDDQAVLLAVCEGDEAVDLVAYPGARMPLYANAGGKAILAHMAADRRNTLLADTEFKPITKHTVTDADELRDQLEAIHERGYAVDVSERIAGFVCIAAPILDRTDTIRGAICVCGPTSRIPESRRPEIADDIQRAANISQVNMDYN